MALSSGNGGAAPLWYRSKYNTESAVSGDKNYQNVTYPLCSRGIFFQRSIAFLFISMKIGNVADIIMTSIIVAIRLAHAHIQRVRSLFSHRHCINRMRDFVTMPTNLRVFLLLPFRLTTISGSVRKEDRDNYLNYDDPNYCGHD